MVAATLKLGIAILNGGNATVQQVASLSLLKRCGLPRSAVADATFHLPREMCLYWVALLSEHSDIRYWEVHEHPMWAPSLPRI